jgi:hypothetical protein
VCFGVVHFDLLTKTGKRENLYHVAGEGELTWSATWPLFGQKFDKNFFGNFESFCQFWCHVAGEGELTWLATWPLFGQNFDKKVFKTLKVFVNFGATWRGRGS